MQPDVELISLVAFSSVCGIFMANVIVSLVQTFLSISKIGKFLGHKKIKTPPTKYSL